ncbi:MAG TPA: adenylate/guanylate cyclase domain-containing protein [Thermoleophilaceae bacterium]
MDCLSCAHPNAEGSRFCAECGQALEVQLHCPDCGAKTAPGQKFCTSCGNPLPGAPRRKEPSNPDLRAYTPSYLQDRIRTEAVAIEGERKQVTVLFADITGSMELASQVDAEDWHHVMDGFFALLCDGVHRFEGSVNKFTGDGIMALFGAPLAHEDHARRACYAALYLRDELARYAGQVRREYGLNFSVRIGMNSGEVVVGAVGDDLNVDYTAIGNTVGLASRVEQLAEPGKAYLTQDTAALVEGWFELGELGEFGIKGVPAPVGVFELAGIGSARSQVEVSSERGLTRFVGRDEELSALKMALASAQEGCGQVVGIVADPGLGKSRLCWEFLQHCRAEGFEVNEGHGVAHGKRIPLLPVIEMMRSYFGISDDDTARSARDKIAGRLLLLDEDFKELLPVLFDFLGVPDPDLPPPANAEARHRQLLTAVRRLVEAGGRTGRTITLIEDLHWLDPSSNLFLEHFVEALSGTHSLVVVNFRPEYQADWMRSSYYRQIPLLPLGQAAIAEMLGDLLGTDPSLDGLAELVHERTGGNPFFIEEVVQSLVGSGALAGRRGDYHLVHSVDRIEIPPTVQAVLAARIDRLPEREKALLQRASVIGRDFSEAVLRRIAGLEDPELGDALRALVTAEFIFERSLYPEAEYSFKHPLTEEVAYRTQLGDRRARTHATVAEAITEVYAERLDEMAAVIANHWEQAARPLEAARWNARAATWAGQNDPREALKSWRRVRALLADAGDEPEVLGLRFAACLWILQGGWRTGMSQSESDAIYAEGLHAAEQLGQQRLQAALKAAWALSLGFHGQVQRALELSTEAFTDAETLGDTELAVSAGTGYWLSVRGRLEEALADLEQAMEVSRDHPDWGRAFTGFSSYAWARQYIGYGVLCPLGRLQEAKDAIQAGLELACEYGDVESELWAHMGFVFHAWFTGESADALAHARTAVESAERLGGNFSVAVTYGALGLAYLMRGEYETAESSAARTWEIIQTSDTGGQVTAWALMIQAHALLGLGDAEQALEVATRGVDEGRRAQTGYYELEAQVALTRALIAVGRLDEAEAAVGRIRELRRETGAAFFDARAEEQLAEIAQRRHDTAAYESHLREAQRLFSRMGATAYAEQASMQLAALPA